MGTAWAEVSEISEPRGEDTGPPYRGGNRGQAPNLYKSCFLFVFKQERTKRGQASRVQIIVIVASDVLLDS
ncbi:hypothetical protein KDK_61220 [Dictyobacter kobayashii]|uniref:Uncharacterized protein n=1 Tax=Dictyobacter kobayashii TaxID=2014872 RepID=A0A402ATA8_9CHLR|nr:hypothetical protein KDK_61220 [Dictyobacter kobayashii]